LSRRELVLELAAVAALFWVPVTLSAVVGFLASRAGGATTRFSELVHGHPLENMILLCLAYVGLAGTVPVTLLLRLRRTGDAPRGIGLAPLSWRRDAVPTFGLAATVFAVTAVAAAVINLIPGFAHLPAYVPHIPRLPAYGVVWAFVVSATTALAEESVMGAYLVTRLEQLGLGRLAIFVVAALGRTAYHSYYGADMVYTLPSTIMFTASLIRQRRLGRVVGAHFLCDFTLMTIAILR
jgi:membrane protease YdiL (CAAX protease family)